MSQLLLVLGALIAVGSAIVFAAMGVLAFLGGADATRAHLIPGFVPDRASAIERFLTLAAVWVPVLVVLVFGILSGIRIVEMVLGAFASA